MVEKYRSKQEILEDRLIDFGLEVNYLLEKLPNTYLGKNIAGQITRSSTSPALNYGEAQAASSTRDYIHKMRIGLKELRETFVGIKFIERGKLVNDFDLIRKIKTEANELISIYISSLNSANKNQ